MSPDRPPDQKPRQIPLDLALPTRLGEDDYVVGEANRVAHDLIAAWPHWPGRLALLIGPEGAGKSHLVSIWAARTGATVVPADALGSVDPVVLAATGAVAVEDLGAGLDEAALFHLWNAATAGGAGLLLTTRDEPGRWGLGLADLASRLRSVTPIRLREPDDALLEALIAKFFADRQTTVDPAVVRFLAHRMERSYRAAAAIVAELDRDALAGKSGITRQLAARVLAGRFSREPELPGLDGPPETDAHSS